MPATDLGRRIGFVATRFTGTDGVSLEESSGWLCWRPRDTFATGCAGSAMVPPTVSASYPRCTSCTRMWKIST